MTISGENLIAGEWSGDTSNGFNAINASTNEPINVAFADADENEINTAITRADQAFY